MSDKKERKPMNYWTYEKCAEVIKDCTTIGELRNKYERAYRLIIKNNWFELTEHLERKCVSKNYWTKEKCYEICKMYTTKKELINKNKQMYHTISEKGWRDELCSHMEEYDKPNGYWIYEKCKEVALLHNKISSFRKEYSTAYSKILKNKWNELLSHMVRVGNLYKRLIYLYIFPDNHFYVGLTCNRNKRYNSHKNEKTSAVYKHRLNTGLEPECFELTDYVDVIEARKLEEFYRLEYLNKGYNQLNKAETGSLGGTTIKWTKEKCYKESILYKTVTQFRKYSRTAHDVAWKKGWLSEFFPVKETIKWNYETAKEYFNKINCNYRKDLYNYFPTFYFVCRENGWLDEFIPLKLIKWDYEKIKLLLKENDIKGRSELFKKYNGAYDYCRNNNLLDEFFPNRKKIVYN